MSGLKMLLSQSTEVQNAVSHVQVMPVVAHSISTGLVIAVSGFILDSVLATKSNNTETDHVNRLVSASNLLLVCVGVSGMMLLIQQNIVRAVVLFAALALVRFRVRVSEKSLTATFFFAVIGGMACGMGEFETSWLFTGIFVMIAGFLSLSFKYFVPKATAPRPVSLV